MRTWFNALPPEHHALEASFERLELFAGPAHAKERVPVPVRRSTVRARKKAGFREQLSARRTVRALA
jgi:hypothetical protein